MRYLGERSVSSFANRLLQALTFIVPLAAVFLIFILSVLCFAEAADDPTVSVYAEFKYNLLEEAKKDPEAWEVTRNSPLIVRIAMLSYISIVSALLFQIVRVSRRIFINFAGNIVFSEVNTSVISSLTRLIIAFSILTFNLSSLIIGIILLILNDILKNGTALQEEHDLTV
ncbi:MAG: hypothetical protein OEY50_10635 [Nitrospinota bacterium]|nr:hypothetical protein [Nitrospinota bacterium]MDH5678814.1 hypothetical protein [Nitrospinota bacterium]